MGSGQQQQTSALSALCLAYLAGCFARPSPSWLSSKYVGGSQPFQDLPSAHSDWTLRSHSEGRTGLAVMLFPNKRTNTSTGLQWPTPTNLTRGLNYRAAAGDRSLERELGAGSCELELELECWSWSAGAGAGVPNLELGCPHSPFFVSCDIHHTGVRICYSV